MTLPQGAARESASPRLNSWKEIAAYLGRDARTVQRWEKSEGLPVHRYWHESQPSVYATTEELDAWLESRREPSSKTPRRWWRRGPAEAPKSVARVVRALPAVVAGIRARNRPMLLAAATLAGALVLVFSFWRGHPVTAFEPGKWVLVEPFEERTGEALFDGTLKAALEMELSNSSFLNVADPQRVDDVLHGMKQPRDTPLDGALAREVARRDPDIRRLVTGRVEKTSAGYRLNVTLVDPADGSMLAAHQETAPTQEQIRPALRRLSNWVRATMGEAEADIERTNREMEHVAAPPLLALKLYSEAQGASARLDFQSARALYRQALAEYPDFAMAHLGLARALSDLPSWDEQRRALEKGTLAELPAQREQMRSYALQRAIDLIDNVSEADRYAIRGGYHSMRGEYAQALPLLEEAVKLRPEEYFIRSDLAKAYSLTQRTGEAANSLARLADLRPNDYRTQANVARELWQIDLERASQYARRAIVLAEEDPSEIVISDVYIVFSLPFFDRWRQDSRAALVELDTLAGRFANSPDPILAWRIGECYLALGRVRQARLWFDRTLPPSLRAEAAVYASYVAGEEEEARVQLRQLGHAPGGNDLIFIAPRLVPDAAKIEPQRVEVLGKQKGGPHHLPGEIALAQGRIAEAVSLLQDTFDKFVGLRTEQQVAESLAKALELSGQRSKALEVLQQARMRDRVMQPIFWVRNAARLSAYYHQMGREVDADGINKELRQLLKIADADFPIFRQLNP